MNEANETAGISGTGNWIEPEYDNAGNIGSRCGVAGSHQGDHGEREISTTASGT